MASMPTASSQATLAAVDEAVSSLPARPQLEPAGAALVGSCWPRASDTSPSKLQKNALIGKGGFGLVYRCTHLSGAEFALKQIHKGRAAKRPLGAQLVAREIAAHEALPQRDGVRRDERHARRPHRGVQRDEQHGG